MALIKCTECGKEFSDKASCCPNCACPTEIILSEISKTKGKCGVNLSKISDEDTESEEYIHTRPEGITITLGSDEYKYDVNDRLFSILYQMYNTSIQPLILEYEKALENDIKAIDSIKLNGIKIALSSKTPTYDLVPYAASMRDIISEYRYDHKYNTPSGVIYDIIEEFQTLGLPVMLGIAKSGKCGFDENGLMQLIKKFEAECLLDDYNDTVKKEDLDDFLRTNKWDEYNYNHINQELRIHISSMKGMIEDELYALTDKFGDFSTNKPDKIIEDAWKEIHWRQEYKKNPQYNTYILTLKDICTRQIFDIVVSTAIMLGFELDSSRCSYEAYQNYAGKMILLQGKKIEDNVQTVKDAFKFFPFDKIVYRHLLSIFGDEDNTITNISNYLEIDISTVKRELLNEYIDQMPSLTSGSVNDISKRIQEIQEKQKYLNYSGNEQIKNDPFDQYIRLENQMRTVNGRTYDSAGEANLVRMDYETLDQMVQNIDFFEYDLFNPAVLDSILPAFAKCDFKSTVFKKDQTLLTDLLREKIEKYKEFQIIYLELRASSRPWNTVEKIIRRSIIKDDIFAYTKFYNFKSLNNPPRLLPNEIPVVYHQVKLIGWSEYWVLTNRRIIYVNSTSQFPLFLDKNTTLNYAADGFIVVNRTVNIQLNLPISCSKEHTEYLTNLFRSLIKALCQCKYTMLTASSSSGVQNFFSYNSFPNSQFENIMTYRDYVLRKLAECAYVYGTDSSAKSIFQGTYFNKDQSLDTMIRQYYCIPSNEPIFLIGNSNVFLSPFKNGIAITNQALYYRNKSVQNKIPWHQMHPSYYDSTFTGIKINGINMLTYASIDELSFLLFFLQAMHDVFDKTVIDSNASDIKNQLKKK